MQAFDIRSWSVGLWLKNDQALGCHRNRVSFPSFFLSYPFFILYLIIIKVKFKFQECPGQSLGIEVWAAHYGIHIQSSIWWCDRNPCVFRTQPNRKLGWIGIDQPIPLLRVLSHLWRVGSELHSLEKRSLVGSRLGLALQVLQSRCFACILGRRVYTLLYPWRHKYISLCPKLRVVYLGNLVVLWFQCVSLEVPSLWRTVSQSPRRESDLLLFHS